jgi:hypothetical protein
MSDQTAQSDGPSGNQRDILEALDRVGANIETRGHLEALLDIAKKLYRAKCLDPVDIAERFRADYASKTILRLLDGKTQRTNSRQYLGMIVVSLHQNYRAGDTGDSLREYRSELMFFIARTARLVGEHFPELNPTSLTKAVREARALASAYLDVNLDPSELAKLYVGDHLWIGKTTDPDRYRVTFVRVISEPLSGRGSAMTVPSFACVHGKHRFSGFLLPHASGTLTLTGTLMPRKAKREASTIRRAEPAMLNGVLHDMDEMSPLAYGILLAPDPTGEVSYVARRIVSVRTRALKLPERRSHVRRSLEPLSRDDCETLLGELTINGGKPVSFPHVIEKLGKESLLLSLPRE